MPGGRMHKGRGLPVARIVLAPIFMCTGSSIGPVHLSLPKGRGLALPVLEDGGDLVTHLRPRVPSIVTPKEQLVIGGFGVADMGDHREADCLFVERLCGATPADAAAVLAACVLRNLCLAAFGRVRIEVADSGGEAGYILVVELGAPPLAAASLLEWRRPQRTLPPLV